MYGSTLILNAFWIDNKPFPTVQNDNSKEGKIFYKHYSGIARRLGWMDLVLLKKVIKKHNVNHIILQDLGALGKIADEIGVVKVCTAYEHEKVIVRSIVSDNFNNPFPRSTVQEKELVHCKPIYEDAVIGGWYLSDDDDEIPHRAQRYMQYLLTHSRVDSITYMNNKIKFTAQFNIEGNVIFKTEPYL